MVKKRASESIASRNRKPVGASILPDGNSRWTFMTNHAHVLTVLDSTPEIVLREVAIRVGITERAVQRIVQDLEDGGVIERERVGRQNFYRVNRGVPLRHPVEGHRTIGDLLKLISTARPSRSLLRSTP